MHSFILDKVIGSGGGVGMVGGMGRGSCAFFGPYWGSDGAPRGLLCAAWSPLVLMISV